MAIPVFPYRVREVRTIVVNHVASHFWRFGNSEVLKSRASLNEVKSGKPASCTPHRRAQHYCCSSCWYDMEPQFSQLAHPRTNSNCGL